ncbi:MAG: TIGR01212 family radical SAM protein [Bacteroidetes bacterium]|nr:MAG: TIGR01212 family radical SAM protein [Bacteroidota bacterium]
MDKKLYNNYSDFIKTIFNERVQKISIDAGFSCPNRDGTKAYGGCSYCDNKTFNPFYCSPEKSISRQLNEGIAFFEPKYKTQKYLAYFQAYTNTYADVETLKKYYDEALSHKKVVGMVISTRPDCVNKEIIDLLNSYTDKFKVFLEFGIESTKDKTLEYINRCHNFAETKKAFDLIIGTNLIVGGHLIIGLPGESNNNFINHAKEISKLPLHTLKLHQLQIIRGTVMAVDYKKNPQNYNLLDADKYIEIVGEFIKYLNPKIIIERFSSESPRDMLIAPNWGGIKNFELTERIKKYLKFNNIYQGINYLK